MKKILLFVLTSLLCVTMYAQNNDKYSVSGGLLGAANVSQFRTHNHIDYNSQLGYAFGAWVNFPISNFISVEPQLQFSTYHFKTSSEAAGLLLYDGGIRNFSIPVLLKFHISEPFALTFGPQLDIMTSIEDKHNVAQKSNFQGATFGLSAGMEFFPHQTVSIFGRYFFGMTNQDVRAGHAASGMEYKVANIQMGLKFKLFGHKIVPAVAVVPPPKDTDGDGITDDLDKCPTVFGLSRYQGCPIPDTDGDGINDEMDKCPTVAGLARYNGCPIPDTDGDGINDEMDKCPTVAGLARYNGCPIPDRDHDGINDEEDKCPDIAGVASNNGCPEVTALMTKSLLLISQDIYFGTGNNKTKLTTKSLTTLDKLVTLMNDNPAMKLKIDGHTNNVGNADANMKLSEDRAAAVKDYLVSKGISELRIKTEGFGGTQPIAENKTAAGRARNNRIELKMFY